MLEFNILRPTWYHAIKDDDLAQFHHWNAPLTNDKKGEKDEGGGMEGWLVSDR